MNYKNKIQPYNEVNNFILIYEKIKSKRKMSMPDRP